METHLHLIFLPTCMLADRLACSSENWPRSFSLKCLQSSLEEDPIMVERRFRFVIEALPDIRISASLLTSCFLPNREPPKSRPEPPPLSSSPRCKRRSLHCGQPPRFRQRPGSEGPGALPRPPVCLPEGHRDCQSSGSRARGGRTGHLSAGGPSAAGWDRSHRRGRWPELVKVPRGRASVRTAQYCWWEAV
jgi:hypothetical protein